MNEGGKVRECYSCLKLMIQVHLHVDILNPVRHGSCLSRPYPFKFFKGCLPQILLGPFLNTLSIYDTPILLWM